MTVGLGLGLLVQVLHRVYRGIVDEHFVMEVGTGGHTRQSHGANNLSAFDLLPHNDRNLAEVTILGHNAESVVNDDFVAVAVIPTCVQDHA